MAIYTINNRTPQIGKDCYIAPSASVIGDVVMKNNSSVWFSTVVRGDIEQIIIGENSNVQDLVMIHTSKPHPTIIGDGVTVGHGAVLHSCTIKNNSLIGIGAIVLDGAVIGENSVVAAGSVVPPGKVFPPFSLIMGSPAKVLRELTVDERKSYGQHYHSYLRAKNDYLVENNFTQVLDE